MMRVVRLAITIVILAQAVLWLGTPAAVAGPSSISFSAEMGVPEQAQVEMRAATDATLTFFQTTYGLTLQRDVSIILVPNAQAYTMANIRENGCDRGEAERRSRTTTAWSSDGGKIIINVGGTGGRADRAFTLGHELVHQYQSQVDVMNRSYQLIWMREGMAQLVGVRVAQDTNGPSLIEYRQDWRRSLARSRSLAPLSGLRSEAGWFAALENPAAGPVYRIAGLAVMDLVDRYGYNSLLVFLTKLDTEEVEEAFAEAFGITLDAYEASWVPVPY